MSAINASVWRLLDCVYLPRDGDKLHQPVESELDNLRNELRARLQRRDVDAQAVQPEGWLDT